MGERERWGALGEPYVLLIVTHCTRTGSISWKFAPLVKVVNVSSERRFSLLIPGLLGPVRESSGGALASTEDDDSPGHRVGITHQRTTSAPRSVGDAHPTLGAAPVLEALLARTDRTDLSRDTAAGSALLETCIFRLFDIPLQPGADLPVAAITYLADGGGVDDGWWLRADPVCLLPQGGGLLLQPGADLELTLAQARALVDEILQVFAADGWHLEAPVAHRWYLRLATPPTMQTTPLAWVAGHDIHPYLPFGKDAKAWHVALNEIQILLHTADVNVERESRGQMPINSVWFWGGGQRPTVPTVAWTHLWSDEVLSRGLAILAGLAHSALPTDAGDWLAQAAAGRHLLVLDPGTILAQAAETDRWPEFFMRLEQQWIVPLVAAVKSGILDSVTLYSEGGHAFHITRKTLGRWWRRRRALSHYH